MTTIQTSLSHDQATKLAAFINTLRPDWDKPGIVDALAKARNLGTAADVSIAAIRAAGSAKNRTPAIIALDGEHWRQPKADPQAMGGSRVLVQGRCEKCQRMHPPADPCIPPNNVAKAAAQRGAAEVRNLLATTRAEHLCECGVLPRHCTDHRPPEETS